MKTSQMITELDKFRAEHGDLEVMVRVEQSGSHGTLRPIKSKRAISGGTIIGSGPDKPVCVVEL